MSGLSPDSLFHFTPSLDNLLGILKNTFYPRYCYEEFDLIDNDAQAFSEDALPMVCFCDIPLSQLATHIENYGEYGLGMSKEWGIGKGLNPVIYFNKNSHMAKKLSVTTNGLLFRHDPVAEAFHDTMGYVKPYEGTLFRGGQPVRENVRFYDEHEWRYMPDLSILINNNIEAILQRHRYMNPTELSDANRKLELDQTRLSFNADDIKYVIISNEGQINQMVEALRDIKGRIYDYDNDTIDRLVSRIITVEQIKNDF